MTMLLMFLTLNDVSVSDDGKQLKELLQRSFPKHAWEQNPAITKPHSLFLYNLAIILGDRPNWETDDFGAIRKMVAQMFAVIHKRKS